MPGHHVGAFGHCQVFPRDVILFYCNIFSENVIGVGVEEEDKKHTWMEDAESVSSWIICSVIQTGIPP